MLYLYFMDERILKLDRAVPRYTSYPTSPHFNTDVDENIYSEWLKSVKEDKPISLYIHVPFCKELCLYCGCATMIVKQGELIDNYCEDLLKEIDMVANILGRKLKVQHLHWGGGTPSHIGHVYFQKVMDKIYEHFDFIENAEIATEIDPRTITEDMAATLANCGINRISFGVQSFDEKVQKAISRVQSYDVVKSCLDLLKKHGIDKINFDLLYGLPLQTVESVKDSIKLTAELSPDRIALFGYAHVPWMRKHQKLLEKYDMPDTTERYNQAKLSEELLVEYGYKPIGIDHFAKPEDEMYTAYLDHKLHRNFQGYTTDTADDLISFGASSIGKLNQGYFQNLVAVREYQNKIKDGKLPIARGMKLAHQDNFRSRIIEEIMCYFETDLNRICTEFDMDYAVLSESIEKLSEYIDEGGVEFNEGHLVINEPKAFFGRLAASCFDEYLVTTQKDKHSRAI